MENTNLTIIGPNTPARVPAIREYVTVGFRWRRRMLLVFAITALAGVLVTLCAAPEYESVMKILVNKERVDPLVAPDQVAASAPREITEEDLNSEVELIKSDDVLRKVVLATGLQNRIKRPLTATLFGSSPKVEEVRIAQAVRQLSKTLTITLPKKSTIITVSYHSKDRRLAEAVLTALSKFYPEKHLAVRRPRGQFDFFDQQAERARQSLSEVQKKVSDSARNSANFAGQAQLDLTVQKLTEQRAALEQTYTAIHETEKRIGALEDELTSTPARMATAVRTADNPELIAQLKATQLQLELKRTELLHKFQPTYRTVQEVDQQLAQTRAAITAAESTPVTDRTTNSDPTYEWIRSELAKAHTELISLQVRANSLAKYTTEYTERARKLSEGNLQQQQLLTTAKALEETYQLYLRKREEARISDALDRSKILNVSLAQLPSLPVLPMHSSITIAGGALFFALLLSVGTGFVSEYLDNSLRSPDEVQTYLGIPVIAALPSGDMEASGASGLTAEL